EPDRELARTRFKAGQALFQRGRAAEALAEFEEGKRSFALPEFDYNIGLCLAKLGRPGDAADALQRYIDARPDDPEATGIWRMIAELRAEAARHAVGSAPPPSPAPPLLPAVIVPPAPPPPPPSSDGRPARRTLMTRLAIAGFSIGGAALVISVATGVSALEEK